MVLPPAPTGSPEPSAEGTGRYRITGRGWGAPEREGCGSRGQGSAPGLAPVSGRTAESTTTSTNRALTREVDAVSSGYVGNNVYNSTGYHQTVTVQARRAQTRTFYVRVYNDGNVQDTIHVFGTAATSGSTVRYYSGSTNITSVLRSSAGWSRTLAPGAYALVKVTVTVGSGAAIGSSKPAKVSGVWTGDGIRTDLVAAVVKVTT